MVRLCKLAPTWLLSCRSASPSAPRCLTPERVYDKGAYRFGGSIEVRVCEDDPVVSDCLNLRCRRFVFRDARGCLGLNAFVHLFAMHGDVRRRREAEAHLAAFHTEHSDGHLIANLDRLS